MKLDDVDADTSGFEDRRGRGGGGLGGLPFGKGGKVGLPAILVLVVGLVVKSMTGGGGGGGGIDITGALDQLGGGAVASGDAPSEPADTKDARIKFVGQIRTLLDEYWSEAFQGSESEYRKPDMVVFDRPTPTGCGTGQPEAGPFYCPPDEKIYIDLGFYEQLEQQLGFGGDFAEAYVLAHEFGHHIQTLTGISQQVREEGQGQSQDEVNELSVKQELQADCFAGAWAHSAYEDDRLEPGDLDEALGAASAVGDDAIQRKTQGSVDRDSFTHGSSADRQKWFKIGFDSGDPERCDTFG